MSSEIINPFEGWDIRTLIDTQAGQRGDHKFLIWEPFEGEGRSWSYAAFQHRVRRFAAGVQARGVKPGDRVLVHLDNCPESIIAWLGCAYAGAVPVTTNAKSSADEISYFARHSKAVGGITQPRFASLVRGAAPSLGWLAVTETDSGAAPADDVSGFETFSAIDADPAGLADRPSDPMAHFAIQYTSGTTARPKAVLWTHANALWGAKCSALNTQLRSDDVHLVYLPLFHTNAQVYSVLATMWAGGSAVLQPRFSTSRFWPASVKHGCTWNSMVPFCAQALRDQPVPERHSYRFFGSGVCSPPWDAVFGAKTIGWWGMTETITPVTIGSTMLPDVPMSIGRPVPGYEVLVLDEAMQKVAPGQVGDLYVRGVPGISLFLEYAGNPEATAAAFTEDGLFITGDRVRLGEDGALFFADRSKDMLKVGGENVAASEVERVIALVPGVAEVAIVAGRHKMLEEVPVAFVIAKEPSDESLAGRIAAACEAELASFKRPHQIRFVEELPRSLLNKIAKAELRAILAAEAGK